MADYPFPGYVVPPHKDRKSEVIDVVDMAMGTDGFKELGVSGKIRTSVYSNLSEKEMGATVMSEPVPVKVARVKKRVTFSGSFGKLTVPYDAVVVDGYVLVLVQEDDQGAFYELPSSDSPMKVSISVDKKTYSCYTNVSFKVPDRNEQFSVFLIEGVSDD